MTWPVVSICARRLAGSRRRVSQRQLAKGFRSHKPIALILVPRCNIYLRIVNSFNEEMAKVIYLQLDPRSAGQLGPLLAEDRHAIHVEKDNAPIGQIRASSAVLL